MGKMCLKQFWFIVFCYTSVWLWITQFSSELDDSWVRMMSVTCSTRWCTSLEVRVDPAPRLTKVSKSLNQSMTCFVAVSRNFLKTQSMVGPINGKSIIIQKSLHYDGPCSQVHKELSMINTMLYYLKCDLL